LFNPCGVVNLLLLYHGFRPAACTRGYYCYDPFWGLVRKNCENAYNSLIPNINNQMRLGFFTFHHAHSTGGKLNFNIRVLIDPFINLFVNERYGVIAQASMEGANPCRSFTADVQRSFVLLFAFHGRAGTKGANLRSLINVSAICFQFDRIRLFLQSGNHLRITAFRALQSLTLHRIRRFQRFFALAALFKETRGAAVRRTGGCVGPGGGDVVYSDTKRRSSTGSDAERAVRVG